MLPHHTPDGGFRNPWPDSEPRGWLDVLRWSLQRRGRAPTPPRGSFPTTTPNVVRPRAADELFTATWVGHATVLLQMGGRNVLTDAMWSERAFPVQWSGPRRIMPPALPLEALPEIDVVLTSHSHYDHLDKSTVERLVTLQPGATWIAPLRLGAYLRDFGVKRLVEMDWWSSVTTSGVTVTATPARHFSARRIGDRNKTLWCGYAIQVGGRRVYFAGDTAYHPEFGAIGTRCGPFDLVLVPIGAYEPRWFMHVVHMNPDEAVQAAIDLHQAHPDRPLPLMLGIHWGTFRLTDEPMEEPPRRTREIWHARGLDDDRLWIARFGETRSW
ncbi:MAG TPA: MBL fold metallo-hydrolase [Gemmatimonadaceae bacterium]